jgi:drug/metabolite transporter (DMT)-like permease
MPLLSLTNRLHTVPFHPTLRASFPLLFVLIWSSGFIIARYGMPHAEPMTFLFMRFVLVLMLLLPMAWAARAVWPSGPLALKIALAGLLLQAGYLGGVWAAVREGMTAGLVALIMGLQPILTAVFLSLLRERISPTQWLGLVLGLSGVGLVVWAKLGLVGLSEQSLWLAALALASITVGTLYQKRACPDFDLRTGAAIQFMASALACLPFVWLLETREVTWHPELIFALAWSVLAISIGAIFLLFTLIREGAATEVTSLLYLTPPTTAAMAWLLFDEPFTLITLMGTLATMVGVWLVSRATLKLKDHQQ